MSKRILGVVTATLVLMGVLAATAPSAQNTTFDDSAELRKAVGFKGVMKHLGKFQDIADANDGNRASGTPGYDATADYIAKKMEKAGYKVVRQEFIADVFSEDGPTKLSQTAPNATEYTDGEDYIVMQFSGPGDVTAPVQAVDLVIPPGPTASTSNSGCEAADFAGFTAGNIALVQRGTCDFSVKVDNAIAAGAAGVIVFNEGQPGRTEVLAGNLSSPLRSVPAIGTTFELGEELANGVTNGATGVTVNMVTDTSSEQLPTENVIATGKRGDKDNIVLSGAHIDSVEEGPGMNDNGSGAAGLLETAIQISKLGIKPENRLRFAWWGAEESGLIGSNYYVSELDEYEAGSIALYLNFDMIGSPNFARFIYDGNGSAFGQEGPPGSDTIERVFQRYFENKGLASGQTAFDGRSDYFAFIGVGIPSGGLFSGAEGVKTEAEQAAYGGTAGEAYDPCYHAACDDIENISRRAMDQMTDAIAHSVVKFGNDLKFVREDPEARAKQAKRNATARDRMGDTYVR